MVIDTATRMVWTGANFSVQWPGGKLSEIFKMNYNVGTGFTYKSEKNWTYGIDFNYYFGSYLRHDDGSDAAKALYRELFGNIFNDNLEIINDEGVATQIYFEGRYWSLTGGVGKLIPVEKKWRNSGVYLQARFGFFQHKIFITDPDNKVCQFKNDYRKIYDRCSSGFMMSQFAGYLFMHKRRVLSFYAGIELTEAWTKPDRGYVFNEDHLDHVSKASFSLLYGLKVGWVVPLFEKKKSITYYTR